MNSLEKLEFEKFLKLLGQRFDQIHTRRQESF